jgi:ribonuclease HI
MIIARVREFLKEMEAKKVETFGDSNLIIQQIKGESLSRWSFE